MATTSTDSLQTYIDAAMRHAVIKWLPNDRLWCATVPPLRGVLAIADRREDLEPELRSVIEGWVEVGLKLGHTIPAVDGISVPPLPIEDRWTPEELAAMEEENRRLYDEEPDLSEADRARV